MPAEDEGAEAEAENFWRERIRCGAEAAMSQAFRAGAEAYERARDLPKLARLDPGDLRSESVESAIGILARLKQALRAERNRARSGHWTYDLNRHIALRQAYLAETERLQALRAARD